MELKEEANLLVSYFLSCKQNKKNYKYNSEKFVLLSR